MKMNEMSDSKYLLTLDSSPEKPSYFSNESHTPEGKVLYPQYTDSYVAAYTGVSQVRTAVGYIPLYHRFPGQVQTLSWESNKIPDLSLEREVGFDYVGLKASNNISPSRGRPVPPSDQIIIVQLREPSYEEAKMEIIEYIRDAGRKVYISELAEKLRLDIELIMQIMEELERD